MEKKIQKRYVYDGFGFSVVLLNVTMGKVRGSWTPLIDYNKLQKDVAYALAHKHFRLTGKEVHYVRSYFAMTLAEFGERFSVSHPAVMKWEKAGEEATSMKWAGEKDIRLFILDRLAAKPTTIGKLYQELRKEAKRGRKPVEIQVAA